MPLSVSRLIAETDLLRHPYGSRNVAVVVVVLIIVSVPFSSYLVSACFVKNVYSYTTILQLLRVVKHYTMVCLKKNAATACGKI